MKRVWRLSLAYIGPKSRTERPRKTKIGTEVAHVTRDLDTTFQFKSSKVKVTRPLYSLPCWRVRQLQRWVWERVGREKLLLRCRLLGRARRFGAHEGEERGGDISWRPPTYSLLNMWPAIENNRSQLRYSSCRWWQELCCKWSYKWMWCSVC